MSFDLAHWVKHLEKIHAELSDGYEHEIYSEFAFDLVRTLGWAKCDELGKALENFTGGRYGLRAAYFAQDGACWSRHEWGSHGDEQDVVDAYRLLGWEQAVLFCHWRAIADREFFDDHAENALPPREKGCSRSYGESVCPVHGNHKSWREVIELPHGPHCPETVAVTPAVTATEDPPSVTPAVRRCAICNGEVGPRRSDGRYCSPACRQKAYRRRNRGAP